VLQPPDVFARQARGHVPRCEDQDPSGSGRDVSELMALLDRASRAEGDEREEAIERVCAMAAEGRIP